MGVSDHITPRLRFVQEAGSAPEPVWTQRLEEKSSASVGDRPPVVQSVVRHYTDWATAAPAVNCVEINFRSTLYALKNNSFIN
jgi:hypothetical protein